MPFSRFISIYIFKPNPSAVVVSLSLFYLLSLQSIYAFHFPHQNVKLRFCFSLLVIVKVAATFTSVFEARGSRLSETFRGPKAKKQPLQDLEATLQPRELVPEDRLQSVDFRGCCCHREVVLEGGGRVDRKRKGGKVCTNS